MNQYKYINRIDDKTKIVWLKKVFGRDIEENLITLNNIDLYNVYIDEYYVKDILTTQKKEGFSTNFFFKVKTPIDKGFYLSSVVFNDYNVEVSIEPNMKSLTRENIDKIDSLEKMYERLLTQELRGLMRKRFDTYDQDCVNYTSENRRRRNQYEVNKILINEKRKQIDKLKYEIEQLEKENESLEDTIDHIEMGNE